MISDKELEDILEQEADSLHSFRIERRSVIDMAKELQQHRSEKQVGVELSDVELDRKAVSYLQDSEFVDAGQIITLTFHQAVQTYMDGYRAAQQGTRISVDVLREIKSAYNKLDAETIMMESGREEINVDLYAWGELKQALAKLEALLEGK